MRIAAIMLMAVISLGGCLYDMAMSLVGKSRMDKFKKNWYSK